MKERPIIYSAPMVRAKLEGRKTMTQRIMKPQPQCCGLQGCWYPEKGHRKALHYGNESHFRRGVPIDFCPHGQPGDRLWGRETWDCKEKSVCGFDFNGPSEGFVFDRNKVVYRADINSVPFYKWRPSIHMPRWASRILDDIVDVRVERVQEISEEDARAEGFASRDEFAAYWNKINGDDAWERNDWVWVLVTRPISNPEGAEKTLIEALREFKLSDLPPLTDEEREVFQKIVDAERRSKEAGFVFGGSMDQILKPEPE